MPLPYKNPTCRGSYALGSACGFCERCQDELHQMNSAGPDIGAALGAIDEEFAKLQGRPSLKPAEPEISQADAREALRLLREMQDFHGGSDDFVRGSRGASLACAVASLLARHSAAEPVLKPCPFCGGTARFMLRQKAARSRIECEVCDDVSVERGTEAYAVAAWNQRA